MRKATLIKAVYEQRQALLARVATLPDEAWAHPCPVPAPPQGVVRLHEPTRTVRDLVAHLCVVDGLALDANLVRPWDALRRLEMPSGWDRRRLAPFLDLSADELVAVLARSGERVARMVSSAPQALGRLPLSGPFGRQPLAQLVTQRVLHEWLHERDIADGLADGASDGRPTAAPAVAEAIVDAVLTLLPEQVLPRTETDGGVVRLVIDVADAPVEDGAARRVWAADFTRRQYGPRVVASPDTTVRLDAAALALLANGRAERLRMDSAVRIDGDEALGRLLLTAIRCPQQGLPCPDAEPAPTATGSAAATSSLY